MLSHHRPTQGHLWSWDKPRRNVETSTAAPFASDGIPPNQTGPIYTYEAKCGLVGGAELKAHVTFSFSPAVCSVMGAWTQLCWSSPSTDREPLGPAGAAPEKGSSQAWPRVPPQVGSWAPATKGLRGQLQRQGQPLGLAQGAPPRWHWGPTTRAKGACY